MGQCLELSGVKQLWYLLCRINRSLYSTRNDFNYLCHFNIKKLLKMQTCFMFTEKKLNVSRVNSLYPRDSIWWYRSGSILTHVMACCLMAPSHYLNQWLHVISEVLWHSLESNFTTSAQATILCNEFENYTFEIAATSSRGQWVLTLNVRGPSYLG